jgi:hypothetical protein
METLRGFPNLPAMVRGQQSWPAPHAQIGHETPGADLVYKAAAN